MYTTIMPGFQQNWNCSGAPESTIVLGQGGELFVGDLIIDTNTNIQYRCMNIGVFDNNATYTGVQWVQVCDSGTFQAVSNQAGWNVNTSRSYFTRTSPAFDTVYTPNASNDTQVTAVLILSSTSSTLAQVDVQIDYGSGFITVIQESLSGIDATIVRSITFMVQANSSYKLVPVSGTTSITQIMELTQ